MEQRSNLAFVQDAIMAMYDYIDGGVPCPYDTPEEWRHALNADALKAVDILRRRVAAENYLPEGVTAPAPTPQADSQPAETSSESATKPVKAEKEAAPSPAEDSPSAEDEAPDETDDPLADAKARKAREEQNKREALRKTLLRLKKKNEEGLL